MRHVSQISATKPAQDRSDLDVMVLTEDQIRDHAVIFERDPDTGLAIVDLFGDLRHVGLKWTIPLTWGQVQVILGNTAQV